MNCTICNKRLTRKTARQVDGVVQCGACMFGQTAQADTHRMAETGTGSGRSLSGTVGPEGADAPNPSFQPTELSDNILHRTILEDQTDPAGDVVERETLDGLRHLSANFHKWIEDGPSTQPHYPNGIRPWSTGDLKHLAKVVDSAIATLTSSTPVASGEVGQSLIERLILHAEHDAFCDANSYTNGLPHECNCGMSAAVNDARAALSTLTPDDVGKTVAWLEEQAASGDRACLLAESDSRRERDLAAGVVTLRRAISSIKAGDHLKVHPNPEIARIASALANGETESQQEPPIERGDWRDTPSAGGGCDHKNACKAPWTIQEWHCPDCKAHIDLSDPVNLRIETYPDGRRVVVPLPGDTPSDQDDDEASPAALAAFNEANNVYASYMGDPDGNDDTFTAANEAAKVLDRFARGTPPVIPLDQGWRGIESAPKDGTLIDLWKLAPDGIHGKRIPDVRWDSNRSFNGGIGRVAMPDAWVHSHGGVVWLDGGTFTHWQHRPADPRSPEGSAGQ